MLYNTQNSSVAPHNKHFVYCLCCIDSPQVYASGKDVVILDGSLRHLQTILGSSRGYSDVGLSCVDCSESSGQIAAVWGCDVVFLQPVPKEELEAGAATRVSSDVSVYVCVSTCTLVVMSL